MDGELWITTEDNPFDPFTQMDRWINYDYQMGYNTCGKLARLSGYSHCLTPSENEAAIDDAIHDLLSNPGINFVLSRDGTHIYRYLPAIKGKTVAWN